MHNFDEAPQINHKGYENKLAEFINYRRYPQALELLKSVEDQAESPHFNLREHIKSTIEDLNSDYGRKEGHEEFLCQLLKTDPQGLTREQCDDLKNASAQNRARGLENPLQEVEKAAATAIQRGDALYEESFQRNGEKAQCQKTLDNAVAQKNTRVVSALLNTRTDLAAGALDLKEAYPLALEAAYGINSEKVFEQYEPYQCQNMFKEEDSKMLEGVIRHSPHLPSPEALDRLQYSNYEIGKAVDDAKYAQEQAALYSSAQTKNPDLEAELNALDASINASRNQPEPQAPTPQDIDLNAELKDLEETIDPQHYEDPEQEQTQSLARDDDTLSR